MVDVEDVEQGRDEVDNGIVYGSGSSFDCVKQKGAFMKVLKDTCIFVVNYKEGRFNTDDCE